MYDLKKIKSYYLKSGLKEEYYAFEIGISQSHFSNCLSGKRKFSKKAISRIAKFHKCSVDDLSETVLDKSSRLKKLSEVEIENIEKVVGLLEHQNLLNDHRIRQVYHKLMDMLIYKREGIIKD